MSGKTHVTRRDSKTVTRNLGKLAFNNEGKLSYTLATKEEPVISYNNLAYLSERNSIVFRAGDNPIWNRNQTIMPMSYKLYGHTITQPGHEYTFSTIPTLSSAKDFDVRKNQPNFEKMLSHRMAQAMEVDRVIKFYKQAYHRDDFAIQQLDPNDYADEIMSMINVAIELDKNEVNSSTNEASQMVNSATENKEQKQANQQAMEKRQAGDAKIFAHGHVSPNDLWKNGVMQSHSLDDTFVRVYSNHIGDFKRDTDHFLVSGDGTLMDNTGRTVYIKAQASSEQAQDSKAVSEAAQDKNSTTYSEDTDAELPKTYKVTDDFYKFLASRKTWTDLADGIFDNAVADTFE